MSRDELAEDESDEGDEGEAPLANPVPFQAVPYRPTVTAIRDELGRSIVRGAVGAGKAVLPGLAVGGAVALLIWKIFRTVEDATAAWRRKRGRDPTIKVTVIDQRRRVVDVDPEEVEGEVVSSRDVPQSERRPIAGEIPKKASKPEPPPPVPPTSIDGATRRARYMRARRLRVGG